MVGRFPSPCDASDALYSMLGWPCAANHPHHLNIVPGPSSGSHTRLQHADSSRIISVVPSVKYCLNPPIKYVRITITEVRKEQDPSSATLHASNLVDSSGPCYVSPFSMVRSPNLPPCNRREGTPVLGHESANFIGEPKNEAWQKEISCTQVSFPFPALSTRLYSLHHRVAGRVYLVRLSSVTSCF
jgi:hypothetical protein